MDLLTMGTQLQRLDGRLRGIAGAVLYLIERHPDKTQLLDDVAISIKQAQHGITPLLLTSSYYEWYDVEPLNGAV